MGLKKLSQVMTEAQDHAYDKKHGIKEGSARDNALDKKRGLPGYAGGSHPGFKGAEDSIMSKEGLSRESAGAILAAGARNASRAAKKANPRLSKVMG